MMTNRCLTMKRIAGRLLLGVALTVGCAPSTYEWTVYLRSSVSAVQPPDEPVTERNLDGNGIENGYSEFLVRPLRWTEEKDKTSVPFADIIGYGHEEVRVVHRDGLQPDRASNAIAGAIKDKNGRNLTLYSETLRQRFYHAAEAEADISIALFLEPGAELRLWCRPALDARTNNKGLQESESHRTQCYGDIKDESSSLVAISVSPSWKQRMVMRKSTVELLHDPIIEITLLDSGNQIIDPESLDDPSHRGGLYAVVELPDPKLQRPFPVPPGSVIQITARNRDVRRIWGFISLKFFCTLDWSRDAELFSKSHAYREQTMLWEKWSSQWGIEDPDKTPERHRSLGVEIDIDPVTSFREAIQGRIR